MAIQTFEIDSASVAARHFPQANAFDDNTKPTADEVDGMVSEAAADVAGALLLLGVDANDIDENSPAYASCAKIVRMMTAIECLKSMTGMDPEVSKSWQATVTAWFNRLNKMGIDALGDPSLSPADENPSGPTTHIGAYNLDTGSTDDASSLWPRLRRDDVL